MSGLGQIVGLDEVRLALACMCVDHRIKGLLIRGPPGTGKSSVVSAMLEELDSSGPVTIPQNVTDSQLLGSLDLDRVLSKGEIALEEGLLSRADGRVMMVDDIDLFDPRFVHGLMGAVSSGRVRVEREGVSATYPCDTSVVATMAGNRRLGGGISDLFDMSVTVLPMTEPDDRMDVIRANLFGVMSDTGDVAGRIGDARSVIDSVTMDDRCVKIIVDACGRFGVRGHRGAISAARVARALAALDGRITVSTDDVSRALVLCLDHRRERVVQEGNGDRVLFFSDSHIRRCIHDDRKVSEGSDGDDGDIITLSDEEPKVCADVSEEVIVDVGEMFSSIDVVEDSRSKRTEIEGHLLRRTVKDTGRDGRYTSSRPMPRGGSDVAVDATVRAAAPYQDRRREETGRSGIILRREDLMQKVRERHMSCLFLFVIDNSGSLVIRSRMRAVKAAVLSILTDHYVRRDSVSIMTFNESFTGPVLPPTRSVGCVRGVLDDIPVGRRTPLTLAIDSADSFSSSYLRTHRSERCFIVLMTDGAANIPMVEGEDPFGESLARAGRVRSERTEWIVIDTSSVPDESERAKRLSEALGCPYYLLDGLRSTAESARRTDI